MIDDLERRRLHDNRQLSLTLLVVATAACAAAALIIAPALGASTWLLFGFPAAVAYYRIGRRLKAAPGARGGRGDG